MTRSFIPHRCHRAIGVLGAVSVASACVSSGTVAESLAQVQSARTPALSIEHPSGALTVLAELEAGVMIRAEVLRTARKLMDGLVYSS